MCGVEKLKFSMNETEKISSAADVEWQRYEYVNENPKGTATKRRLTLKRSRKLVKCSTILKHY
jgi:sarcosine oxidase delta subunit